MPVSGSDVPGKYDLVIDVGGTKTGYIFDETIDPTARLFGKKKAAYSYSPTFVERQNVQGNYGDDSQAFWLTASQNDWSLGEDQKFFRANDADQSRRYWLGSKVDVRTPGAISMRSDVNTIAFAANTKTGCSGGLNGNILVATATNLYDVSTAGTITDRGAHGLGTGPARYGIAYDGLGAYLAQTGGASVGIRRYDTVAHTFSTFSATKAESLAYTNNTLYGYDGNGAVLRRYDTAGVATNLFTWSTATGGTSYQASGDIQMLPYGGKLLILRPTYMGVTELWLYDGAGVTRLHSFDENFSGTQMAISNGVVFVAGLFRSDAGGSTKYRHATMYYANGTPGMAWLAQTNAAGGDPAIGTFDSGVVWVDGDSSGSYVYYNLATGGVSRLAATGISSANSMIVSTPYSFMRISTGSGASADLYPATSAVVATSSTVTSSLFDFDSSLDKLMRGIKVDFDSATTGNGGSVDIAYRVGDVDGSFTTLQTGATSGTEYTISGVTGRNVSVKITLNKGTSTLGPVLKRVYVRAVPVLRQNKLREYTLACLGDPSDQNAIQRLRDGTPNPKTGREQSDALITAVTSTTPVTIYDRFSAGGYTAVLEPAACEIIEIHAEPRIPPAKSGSFIAIATAREV